MKIIFMGTPHFAVPTLQSLTTKHEVVAVYTQAPKPAGRGQKETFSPVHEFAIQAGIPVCTTRTLRNEAAQEAFHNIEADVAIVVAYGLIIPKAILNIPKHGFINIHPSLLPFYRGAAPMQRTILAGETETAMCIMQMDEGIDTGDILAIKKIPLATDTNFVDLSNRMANLGAEMLLEVLDNIDSIKPLKQPIEGSYANKIAKEEGELNWQEDSQILLRKVLAFNPWPGTYFLSAQEKIKVLSAKAHGLEHHFTPGTIIDEKECIIACKKGAFQPTIMQRPGKKPMDAKELLRGYTLQLTLN